MRIGLVRHFKVNMPTPSKFLISHKEVADWFNDYDQCTNLNFKKINSLHIHWTRCYSSPLYRSKKTAQYFFDGEIIIDRNLAELNILDKINLRLKLPFIVWAMLIRSKSSHVDYIQEYEQKLSKFLDDLIDKSDEDILIVSHYFTMKTLRKELLKRNFSNNSYNANSYGEVFVFEKQPT